MASPKIQELLLRPLIRSDRDHEAYNKMTNDELLEQKEERANERFKNKTRDEISQDIDFCILYDALKIDFDYEKQRRDFWSKSHTLSDLNQKRNSLLRHANLVYQRSSSVPLNEEREYLKNTFDQVRKIDAEIKKLSKGLHNPDWRGLIDPIA